MGAYPQVHFENVFETINSAQNVFNYIMSGFSFKVNAFIKSDRTERYPGLTIKYVRGADPVIKLLDDEEVINTRLGSSDVMGLAVN